MPIDKRKVQEINAGSMADIAFLLLIFFLVATTMNVDTGIARNLPPMPPEDQKVEDMKVKIRNLLPVLVNGRGDIFVGRAGEQEYVDIHQLKDRAKDFLLNVMDDPNLPEKEVEEFELPDGSKWSYPVGKGVLSLQTTKDTQYQIYIMVQLAVAHHAVSAPVKGLHPLRGQSHDGKPPKAHQAVGTFHHPLVVRPAVHGAQQILLEFFGTQVVPRITHNTTHTSYPSCKNDKNKNTAAHSSHSPRTNMLPYPWCHLNYRHTQYAGHFCALSPLKALPR